MGTGKKSRHRPASSRALAFSSSFILHPSSFLFLFLFLFLPACSPQPPDELFIQDIRTMAMVEREMGFDVRVETVEVLGRRKLEGRVEVDIRVTGQATHRDLTIGAVLPASSRPQPSWASWKYFCRKEKKIWVIEEKFKVDEGFLNAQDSPDSG